MNKMFRNVLTIVLCCALLSLLITGCSTNLAIPHLELPKIASPMPKELPFTSNLETMPGFPGRIMVYKFVERDPVQVKENFKNYLQQRNYTLDFFEGNQVFLTDENVKFSAFVDPEEKELKQLPTKEEAIEIAVDFLRETGYYSPDLVSSSSKIGFDFVSRFNGDERTDLQVNWCIPFMKHIEGYPVLGAGITVRVGHKGNIDWASIGYMETQPYREVGIITPEEALTILTDEKSSLYIPDGAEELFIDKVELAYFQTNEPVAKQPYLQPVYIVSGKVKPVLDPEYETWQSIVPAMKP